MSERPILFSGPMIRAILAGTKTQTRRVCKGQRELSCVHDFQLDRCPYGQPGARLWVRETWMDLLGTGIERKTGDHGRYAYCADTPPGSYGDEVRKDYGLKWKPSIHMPRAASRITLEVTGVRVERLQDISEADTVAEGIPAGEVSPPDAGRFAYRLLWDSINGPRSWPENPWVWVVAFKRVT